MLLYTIIMNVPRVIARIAIKRYICIYTKFYQSFTFKNFSSIRIYERRERKLLKLKIEHGN